MIEIKNVHKSFSEIKAIDDISLNIGEGSVFGLIGTNGAGKSTLMRMISGVIKPDQGTITIDGETAYDNVKAKEKQFFIADEPYYFLNASPRDMADYYATLYRRFDRDRFYRLLDNFMLDRRRKINTFSKGMKKQLSILLGISSGAEYLLCDETFDGLDPVMRQAVKSLFAQETGDNGFTPVIASHNLRELEDICDHVGLIHAGGVILSKDLEDMKINIQKVQCVLREGCEYGEAFKGLDTVKFEQRGRLYTLTVRGTRENTAAYFRNLDTVFFEVLPLSLEEIFISETEVVGYDVKKLILG